MMEKILDEDFNSGSESSSSESSKNESLQKKTPVNNNVGLEEDFSCSSSGSNSSPKYTEIKKISGDFEQFLNVKKFDSNKQVFNLDSLNIDSVQNSNFREGAKI